MPFLMNDSQLEAPKNATGVEPLSMSLTASPPPRNGTLTMSAPFDLIHCSMYATSGIDGAV